MTSTTIETIRPRIYVACLAAYNNGRLHGAWIDAAQGAWGIWEDVRAMLAASPIEGAEEYAIHDHEGFEGIPIAECTGFEEVAALAAFGGVRDAGNRAVRPPARLFCSQPSDGPSAMACRAVAGFGPISRTSRRRRPV